MSEYRVDLEVYNGPLDLLLFLIRREEIDIYHIPLARITGQYLAYVELLKDLDPEAVSEFLVLAATLMEIKSRMLLPKPPPEEVDEDFVDPRAELVRQLLQYKVFKDAARSLEDAGDLQGQRHPRWPATPLTAPDDIELENIEIWDLFDAFTRLLDQIGTKGAVHQIGIDDTPLLLHAADIMDSIQRAGGRQQFEEIFAGRSKAEMIGLFLALLELIRRARVRVSQDEAFGSIFLHLIDATPLAGEIEEGFEEEAGDRDEDLGVKSKPKEEVAYTGDGLVDEDTEGELAEPPAPLTTNNQSDLPEKNDDS